MALHPETLRAARGELGERHVANHDSTTGPWSTCTRVDHTPDGVSHLPNRRHRYGGELSFHPYPPPCRPGRFKEGACSKWKGKGDFQPQGAHVDSTKARPPAGTRGCAGP
jgi:hypothetical protein